VQNGEIVAVHVNEVVIIESLSEGEAPTGAELHATLSTADLPIPVKLIQIDTAAQLFDVLTQMHLQAQRYEGNWVPLVHFEIHGDEERRGLVMASGELVAWKRVASYLREVNIATKNSVIVVLGVCSGAFLLTAAATSPFEPAPFCGLIGPDRPVLNFFLPHGFRAFYLDLLSSGDFVTAVNLLRQRTLPEYGGYDTAMLFRIGWTKYETYNTHGEVLAERVKKIMRRMPPAEIAQHGSRNRARAAIAARIRDAGARRDEYYAHFVMADIYPENAQRFPFQKTA
jgi:hypothetical protein